MEPIRFKEVNKTLLKPENMTDEECSSLPIFTNGEECISKWKMNFKERVLCLFYGYVWIRIFSKHTQPPIIISIEKTVFL